MLESRDLFGEREVRGVVDAGAAPEELPVPLRPVLAVRKIESWSAEQVPVPVVVVARV